MYVLTRERRSCLLCGLLIKKRSSAVRIYRVDTKEAVEKFSNGVVDTLEGVLKILEGIALYDRKRIQR